MISNEMSNLVWENRPDRLSRFQGLLLLLLQLGLTNAAVVTACVLPFLFQAFLSRVALPPPPLRLSPADSQAFEIRFLPAEKWLSHFWGVETRSSSSGRNDSFFAPPLFTFCPLSLPSLLVLMKQTIGLLFARTRLLQGRNEREAFAGMSKMKE